MVVVVVVEAMEDNHPASLRIFFIRVATRSARKQREMEPGTCVAPQAEIEPGTSPCTLELSRPTHQAGTTQNHACAKTCPDTVPDLLPDGCVAATSAQVAVAAAVIVVVVVAVWCMCRPCGRAAPADRPPS